MGTEGDGDRAACETREVEALRPRLQSFEQSLEQPRCSAPILEGKRGQVDLHRSPFGGPDYEVGRVVAHGHCLEWGIAVAERTVGAVPLELIALKVFLAKPLREARLRLRDLQSNADEGLVFCRRPSDVHGCDRDAHPP